jgi:type II secretory pathway pseudopilin PulG
VTRRIAALRRGLAAQGGFTMIETLASMSILMTVMGGLTGLLVSGTTAQVEMNRRFQAQTQARIGLDFFRREVHCASGSTAANPASSVTLTMTGCPTAAGATSITWCVTTGGELWRYSGTACSGTGRRYATHLVLQNAFTYTVPTGSVAAGTGQLAFLQIRLHVNLTPAKTERTYELEDRIVLRNSTRPA